MREDAKTPVPFSVEYDSDAEAYFIFAPDGCVLVNGEAATIDKADNDGNVWLDIDYDDPPDYLYAHVRTDDGVTYNVTFDGEETKDGAKWNIKVVRFGKDDFDGNSYDILTSAINLSTSTMPFEPVFDAEGKLSGYRFGIYPYGRQFQTTTEIDDGAKVAVGFIGLEITHAYSSATSSTPTQASAKVVLISDAYGSVGNVSTEKTIIPLYFIRNGVVVVDCRCLMALAVRE